MADKATVTEIVRENISNEARLHTDESRLYGDAKAYVAAHETIHHASKEYARGDVTAIQLKATSQSSSV